MVASVACSSSALPYEITRRGWPIRGRKTQMADPDSGTWNYDYDALGELVWQQSPNQLAAATQTTMTYDVLGRMVEGLRK